MWQHPCHLTSAYVVLDNVVDWRRVHLGGGLKGIPSACLLTGVQYLRCFHAVASANGAIVGGGGAAAAGPGCC